MHGTLRVLTGTIVLMLFAGAPALLAQAPQAASTQAPAAEGPPPPALPETISRDDRGRATVRAVRVTTPMKIDGRLEEPLYAAVKPASDFIQMEPSAGQVATEKTEVWVFYDDDNVYVSVRASESHPERMVANEMRREIGRAHV